MFLLNFGLVVFLLVICSIDYHSFMLIFYSIISFTHSLMYHEIIQQVCYLICDSFVFKYEWKLKMYLFLLGLDKKGNKMLKKKKKTTCFCTFELITCSPSASLIWFIN